MFFMIIRLLIIIHWKNKSNIIIWFTGERLAEHSGICVACTSTVLHNIMCFKFLFKSDFFQNMYSIFCQFLKIMFVWIEWYEPPRLEYEIKYEGNDCFKTCICAYAFVDYTSQQSCGFLFNWSSYQQPVGVRALGTKLHWNLKVRLDLIHHILMRVVCTE